LVGALKILTIKQYFLSILFSCCLFQIQALTFTVPPPGQDMVGQVVYFSSAPEDTLIDLAMRYDVGREEMQAVNPNHDLDAVLPTGTAVIIPTRYILPDYPRRGIIVNLSEMRLYYYPPNTGLVLTYPIGIGKQGHMTPVALTKVVRKLIDPPWIPPQSIRDFNKKQGIILPKVIRGGPDNPLGRRAMYLAIPEYLIHATNFPESIGSRGSFGCIRVMEQDIEEFFPQVGVNTPVRIIEEPYKAGWYDGQIYLEAHPPLMENKFSLTKWIKPILASLQKLAVQHHREINWYKVRLVLQRHSGMPTAVSDADAMDSSPLYVMKFSPKWPAGTTLCRLSKDC
jgi:L,D-transpeptidase ErfK/SrfK